MRCAYWYTGAFGWYLHETRAVLEVKDTQNIRQAWVALHGVVGGMFHTATAGCRVQCRAGVSMVANFVRCYIL